MSSRWIFPLCLASLLWAFSFGLNATLASHWMKDAGCIHTIIGLNTAVYYLGIALAASVVPWLMRSWGHGCLLVGMFASAVTAAAFPWGGGLGGWFGLRLLNGFAAALSLIPLETCVNHRSPADRRARNFGYYAFSIALGMALGTLTGMSLYVSAPRLAFVLGGVAALLGGAVVLAWRPSMPTMADEGPRRSSLEFRRNFLSFGSGWCQGFLEGGLVALLPVYLLSIGLTEDEVGWLIGGVMIGIIVAQVPLSWLADHLGRTLVLAECSVVSLIGIRCMMQPGGYWLLATWLFLVGACSGALYPLGLARLGERLPPTSLARAGAWFLAINCLGSIIGPVAAGGAMDCFGRDALFLTGGAAIGLVLVVWSILELNQRQITDPMHVSEHVGQDVGEPTQAAA